MNLGSLCETIKTCFSNIPKQMLIDERSQNNMSQDTKQEGPKQDVTRKSRPVEEFYKKHHGMMKTS